jgi:DNA polymerase delta subunit 2
MEATLRWRHLAPTAPDTLTCYPFVSSDPFVLEECPHAYVVGNQPEFATRLVTGAGGASGRGEGLAGRGAAAGASRAACWGFGLGPQLVGGGERRLRAGGAGVGSQRHA